MKMKPNQVVLASLFTAVFAFSFSAHQVLLGQESQDEHPAAITGSWVPDIERTKELHKDSDDPEVENMLSELESITLTFKEDGEVTLASGDREMNASWTAEKDESDDKVYVLKMKRSEDDPGMTFKVEILDKKSVKLTPEGELTAVLVRKEKSEGSDDGDDVSSMIIGTWNGDAEATAEAAIESGVEESQVEALKNELGKISLTFNEDGSYKVAMQGGDEVETGEWEFSSTDEEGVYELVAHVADSDRTHRFTVTMKDGKASFQRGDRPAGVFSRQEDN